MPFHAGSKEQFAGSMAAAMEHAFIQAWPGIMGTEAPQVNQHMKLLFIAIAQGVVRHLKDNENSITVTAPIGGSNMVIDADISTQGILY
jgi:hypothetical protein